MPGLLGAYMRSATVKGSGENERPQRKNHEPMAMHGDDFEVSALVNEFVAGLLNCISLRGKSMAAIYGAEVGIGTEHLIGALLLVQFVGIPFTFAFGQLADRVGARTGIFVCLAIYTLISLFGFYMSEAWHFWALAIGVAMAQGGIQGRGLVFAHRDSSNRRGAAADIPGL